MSGYRRARQDGEQGSPQTPTPNGFRYTNPLLAGSQPAFGVWPGCIAYNRRPDRRTAGIERARAIAKWERFLSAIQ
ncbi:Hypothetical protein NTJ_10774 [Nesidiocoris tenuis]|uniref:Uncharacterized protein n=1 Tax=Nesidiocoris tenuis TaxID=355587 RepID=A0ABN7B0L7_9HEMI|nr:Hypothetical protein NTJ_10774 [Nesidiocoris tenuis]